MNTFAEKRRAPRDLAQRAKFWSGRCVKYAIAAYMGSVVLIALITIALRLAR